MPLCVRMHRTGWQADELLADGPYLCVARLLVKPLAPRPLVQVASALLLPRPFPAPALPPFRTPF